MIVKAVAFNKLDEKKLLEFISANERVQVVPLLFFKGERHAVHSINQTLKAFAQGENISKTQGIEFLLRFLGERQIKKAVSFSRPSEKSLFVCWADDADSVFKKFSEIFDFKELKLPVVSLEDEKKAIEKTAVFFLIS